MNDTCELYFRQRDTKKIPESFKHLLEESLRGLPNLTFVHSVSRPLNLSNASQLQRELSILSYICRKSTPSCAGAQPVTLRSYLNALVASTSRLAALRADADLLRDCLATQAKRKAAREAEEREGLVLISREEEAIGMAEADIKNMEKEAAVGCQQMANIEVEIEDLKAKIEKSFDPSKAAVVEKEIQMSKKRLLDVELSFSTAKKNLENLEGQLGKKKSFYKSKLNLESTIKKHNEDLEEKVRTTRKEIEARSSTKKPVNHRRTDYECNQTMNSDDKEANNDNNTPVKQTMDGKFDSCKKGYQTPGSVNRYYNFKTPHKTALRFQDSPGFSPTYELAEIEHGCKILLPRPHTRKRQKNR